MNIDSLTEFDRARVKELTRRMLGAILVIFLIIVAIGPMVAPGTDSIKNQIPDKPVTNCRDSPTRTISANPSVVGTIHRGSNNSVTITYRAQNSAPSDFSLGVDLPRNSVLVNETGFQSDAIVLGGSPLQWNESSSTHIITYRMKSGGLDSYPSTDSWLLAGIPKHTANHSIHLQVEPKGYVGSNFLFIGDYSTVSVVEGCQAITAITPKSAVPIQDWMIRNRLNELKVAARSLPLDRHYTHVRAFALPVRLEGDVYGYNPNFGNEFVITTKTNQDSSVVWIHEYVHTMQDIRPASGAEWTIEASANYLAYRVAVENGFIHPHQYDGFLAINGLQYGNSTLAEARHSDRVAYSRGVVLLAMMDKKLQRRGKGSVLDLIRTLNGQSVVTNDDLVSYLDEKGIAKTDQNVVQAQIHSRQPIMRAYILGPEWMPSWVRNLIGNLINPIFRLLSAFALCFLVIGLLYETFLKGSIRIILVRILDEDDGQ